MAPKPKLTEKYPTATLTAYVPAANPKVAPRPAVVICPGGGYSFISPREAEPIARKFLGAGMNAYVLRYTTKEDAANYAPLIQAALAIKLVRERAEEDNTDPTQVYIVGFSAGGHLAASLGILWHINEVYEAVDMPFGYNKPAGMMLNYPVITGSGKEYSHYGSFKNLFCTENVSDEQLYRASLENHVDERSVPAFIFHTSTDKLVPVQSALRLADAYAEKRMPFELHIYPNGPHGMALANEITSVGNRDFIDPAMEKWIENAVVWSKKIR